MLLVPYFTARDTPWKPWKIISKQEFRFKTFSEYILSDNNAKVGWYWHQTKPSKNPLFVIEKAPIFCLSVMFSLCYVNYVIMLYCGHIKTMSYPGKLQSLYIVNLSNSVHTASKVSSTLIYFLFFAFCFLISEWLLIWLTTKFWWNRLDYMVELSKMSNGLNRTFPTDVNVFK